MSAGLVGIGPLRIDPLNSDVQRQTARPILDVSKQYPARRGTAGGAIRVHWIEERRLELVATDELARQRDEDEREIAGSEASRWCSSRLTTHLFACKNDLARSRSPSASLKMK